MLTINIPPELEQAVSAEADQMGTTAELLTLEVLQERFLHPAAAKPLSEGRTLAEALGDYIGAINTSEKYPEGSTLSVNTGRKFAQGMVEKRKQGKL